MKKLNKKGFTLIELLAVIVILAILVAVAVPAVTRYLNTARKGTYADNAQAAISVVRNDVISQFGAANGRKYYLNGSCSDTTLTTEATCTSAGKVWTVGINDLLEKKLKNSPYGSLYDEDSYVEVIAATDGSGSYTYNICLVDESSEKYGIKQSEDAVNEANVVTGVSCS